MCDIVDTLFLDATGIKILQRKYPSAITTMTAGGQKVKSVLVIIKPEAEEEYAHFLIDNTLATASKHFVNRLLNDEQFASQMKGRIAVNRKLFGIDKLRGGSWSQNGE